MANVRYGVTRNVEARDEKGRPVRIALAVVEHENGYVEKVAINEDLIRFAGEGIIEDEIRRKLAR